MPFHFKLQQGNSQFQFLPLNCLGNKISKLPQTHIQIFPMLTQSGSTKRPTCPSCCKPISICLCSRLRTPILHNSVAVTILQHSIEKKHPLNSARIAALGLQHAEVYTVSDVNFQARFFIRLLDSSCGVGRVKSNENRHLFDEMPIPGKNDEFLGTAREDNADLGNGAERHQICHNITRLRGFYVRNTAINFTIVKYGAISSFNCNMGVDKCEEMSFDQLLASDAFVDEARKGFVVTKLKMNEACEESKEFEIAVPRGSVLLFPSERSVNVESVEFEVNNLIVLDGTWAKAKRMYNENPWLKLLPHVRLDLDLKKPSLYGEVRHQPRAGYLSTIESIVYAMKAVGEDSDRLDGLLDVFESMVGDQRRCKNERLSFR